MTSYSGSISKIESFSKFDGPGIRSVVFLSGCNLRCKYCHNPEMWKKESDNITSNELVEKLLRNKPYFKNGGGVTFSGGEPLLQKEFLLDVMKRLKEEDINIALDTAGYVSYDVSDILKYTDLVLLDIKHIDSDGYHDLTGGDISVFEKFLKILNKSNVKVFVRQVIVPGINDNFSYMEKLKEYLKRINNIEKIEFLPFHRMGFSKYEELGINNPLKDTLAMDKDKCDELYDYFLKI